MFLYGLGTSAWDVAMNVEAAAVERRLGRSVMPRFHAAFSLGTIVGAAVGGVSSAAGLPVTWHLVVTAALVGAAVPVATSRFITEREVPDAAGDTRRPGALAAWTERRTVAIGLVVLAFALCEGLANDWLALTMVDAYGTSETIGAATFAAFVSAMTLGRTVGGAGVDKYGRVAALRGTAVLVVLGTAAVATSPHPAGAVVGAVLWGLGASLGFPLGMTAAGEDERHAAARVSVVASIGYAAFLGGPPVAGMLADSFGFRRAVLFAAVAAVAGFLTAGAARRKDTEPAQTAHGQ
jgi:predicted MFS family arabinose efflux permease